jgi:hypothetical protein
MDFSKLELSECTSITEDQGNRKELFIVIYEAIDSFAESEKHFDTYEAASTFADSITADGGYAEVIHWVDEFSF